MTKSNLKIVAVLSFGLFFALSSLMGLTNAAAEKITIPDVNGIQIKDSDAGGTLRGQYSGKKIIIATKQGEMQNGLQAAISNFEKASGAEVELDAFPDANYMDKVQVDLSSGHTFDIVLMPVAFIHSYAQSGYLKPLANYIHNKNLANPGYDVNDLIPSLLDIYGKFKGVQYAIPYKPDVLIFFYRKDLFEDPNIRASFKQKTGKTLKVPQTLDELYQTAQFFTKSFNPNSPTQYGFNMMGQKGSARNIFNVALGAYGGKDVDKDFNPGFDNIAGVKAMNAYLELGKYCAPEWVQFGWDDANNFFTQGHAAMMMQWPGLADSCESNGSKVSGKIGYAICPGQAPELGGWAIAITKASKNLDLAYKFCEYVTSKDIELLKVPSGNDPCRVSNYLRLKSSKPLYPVLLQSLEKAKILADPDVPYLSSKMDDIEDNIISNVISNKMTPKKAVHEMALQFKQATKDAGLTK